MRKPGGMMKAAGALACAVLQVALSVVLYLGSFRIVCFCKSDPDGCGEVCHVCDAGNAHAHGDADDCGPSLVTGEGCLHVEIAPEALAVSDGAVRVPSAAFVAVPASWAADSLLRRDACLTFRAMAPPRDPGGVYLSYAWRLTPLS